MAHLGQLTQLVQTIARNYSLNDLLGYAEETGWNDEDNLSYVDLTNSSFLMTIGIPQRHASEVSVEFLKVTGTIKPHWHSLSDAVVLALCEDECKESAWFDAEEGRWGLLYDRDVVVVPRGVEHGFRADEPHHRSLYLLSVSSPAIKDGDTQYVRE